THDRQQKLPQARLRQPVMLLTSDPLSRKLLPVYAASRSQRRNPAERGNHGRIAAKHYRATLCPCLFLGTPDTKERRQPHALQRPEIREIQRLARAIVVVAVARARDFKVIDHHYGVGPSAKRELELLTERQMLMPMGVEIEEQTCTLHAFVATQRSQ